MFNESAVSVWEDEKVLTMDGCATMRRHSMLLACTLTMVKKVRFMLCTFYQNKINKRKTKRIQLTKRTLCEFQKEENLHLIRSLVLNQ